MELTLVRMSQSKEDSLGFLFIDNKFFCYTLEDEKREIKVYGETRIPAGKYEIVLRYAGGLYEKYSKRFNEKHPMLWLKNVPGFKWIYIHILNTEDETDGCIGVGEDYRNLEDGRRFLYRSTKTYLQVHKRIRKAIEKNNEEVWIQIIDADFEGTG